MNLEKENENPAPRNAEYQPDAKIQPQSGYREGHTHDRIEKVVIGNITLCARYPSNYPEKIVRSGNVHICEFCLAYFHSSKALDGHRKTCRLKSPPANEIYHSIHEVHGSMREISVFEADGLEKKVYCERLCLLSRLFLGLKNSTDIVNVELLLFYIFTLKHDDKKRIVGYFSVGKQDIQNINCNCMMVLPHYQSVGIGWFLIDFCYLLSRKINSIGTPERPLSKLGDIAFTNYWKHTILNFIVDKKEVSIKEISAATHIARADIVECLEKTGLLVQDVNNYSIKVSLYDLESLNHPRISVNPECLRCTKYEALSPT